MFPRPKRGFGAARNTYAREHSSAAVDWAAVRTLAAAAKKQKKK